MNRPLHPGAPSYRIFHVRKDNTVSVKRFERLRSGVWKQVAHYLFLVLLLASCGGLSTSQQEPAPDACTVRPWSDGDCPPYHRVKPRPGQRIEVCDVPPVPTCVEASGEPGAWCCWDE